MKIARGLVTLTIILTIGSYAAAADPTPTAEDLYAEGQSAYDRADYATAVALWRAAYRLSGAAGLVFDTAQALRLSGDCQAAIEAYHRFVEIDPTSDQRPLAETFVRELAPTCAPDASPRSQPSSPPQRAANLVPGLTTTKHVSGRRLKISGAATGLAGAAAIAAGLGLGHHAQTLGADVTRTCAAGCAWSAQEGRDAAGRRDAAIGQAFVGVGAAAIVGGAVAYYLGARRPRVTVEPRPREGGATISWRGAW